MVAAGNLCPYREKIINAAGAGSRSNCLSIGPQETSAAAQGCRTWGWATTKAEQVGRLASPQQATGYPTVFPPEAPVRT